jgi:hypothetical protein
MLAYLTDEQPTSCEQASLDVALVVPTPDDQRVWAQVAYEAAQQLEPERWIPTRRRSRARRCSVLVSEPSSRARRSMSSDRTPA